MKEEKRVILSKDVFIFVGFNKEKKEVKIVPYIFNKKETKIKDLLDNEVVKTHSCFINSFFEKKYNVKVYDAKLIGNVTNLQDFSFYNLKEKLTQKDLNKIVKLLTKSHTKELNYICKEEEKENKEKIFQNNYNNF